MNYKTITELYLDDVKVSQVETKDLENTREFMDIHYGDMEEATSIPTSLSFSFSIDGNVNTADAAHSKFLFEITKDILNLKYYIGDKAENFGFNLPVIVEKSTINHTGGGTVGFSASFKAAGPITPIE